jgi:type I restriction-modification system DNA methylase subunit/site-specific recombinase XerD
MGDIVQGLTDYLPMKAKYPSLFEHIIATIPREKGELEIAKKASAFLLLNQIVFYSILKKRGLKPIDYESLKDPAELYTTYFKQVVDEIDYNAIFNFDVASLFPRKSLQYIKDMVRIVSEIQPEEFTRDLLGNIFHSLIPLEVRKPVAAYYTNPMAARLLAKLAINEASSTVADFACGSGTLLMAAYERKGELLNNKFTIDTHRQFIENDITGLDIMPFAAHLAVVQLALKNPSYLTDRVRIGVRDSTGLNPGDIIKALQRVLPRGQQVLSTFTEDYFEKMLVDEGALSGKGEGQEFKVSKVDVVIMNPPFTRQEKIPADFKSSLQKRFGDYGKFIDPQMGLRAYFILLADRFLKPNGRMAFVLAATTARVESMRGIRSFITTKYDIDYIITTDYRSAFSESTALREILLIARKKSIKDKREKSTPCIVANLRVLPSKENISDLEKILVDAKKEEGKSIKSDIIEISRIEQKEFSDHVDNWSVLIHSMETIDGLLESFSSLDTVCLLEQLVKPKDVKRCDYPSIMHVAWKRERESARIHHIISDIRTFYRVNGVEVKLTEHLSRRITYKDRAPTPEELTRLLEIADLRTKTIVSMLALGGFRESTLSMLQYRHVKEDIEKGITPIHIHVEADITKGKYGDFDTFLGQEAAEYLKLYLDQRRQGSPDGRAPPEKLTDTSPLIRDETSHDPRPIGPKQFYKLVHQLYAKAGLLKAPRGRMYELRLHSLRKYFKTQLLALGVQSDYVDYMMGHTVDTYHDIQSLGVEKLRNVYAAAGLSIKPKTKVSKIDALKEIIRAWGMNPEQVLAREALSQGATVHINPQDRENYHLQVLRQTLKELIRQETNKS